jgi:hypothetical protein
MSGKNKSKGPRARNWVFTVNNYSKSDVQELRDLFNPEDPKSARYLIFGYERGKKKGTPHLQGFISYEKQVTWTTIQKRLPQGTHIDVAKGTPQQAADYCKKEATGDPDFPEKFEEFGDLPAGKGARTDLDGVVELVRAGKRLRDIAESAGPLFIKYSRGIERLIQVTQSVSRPKPDVVFIWGVAGAGKSTYARLWAEANYDSDDIFYKPQGKWWPSYSDQLCVIFNDFESSSMPLSEWCRVFEDTPHYAETKGGNVPLKFEQAIVTSNFPLQMLWPGCSKGRRRAAIRRVTSCLFFWQDLNDPYCPVNQIVHDPFEIPPEAFQWVMEMEPQCPEDLLPPDYLLQKGAANHYNQNCQ